MRLPSCRFPGKPWCLPVCCPDPEPGMRQALTSGGRKGPPQTSTTNGRAIVRNRSAARKSDAADPGHSLCSLEKKCCSAESHTFNGSVWKAPGWEDPGTARLRTSCQKPYYANIFL